MVNNKQITFDKGMLSFFALLFKLVGHRSMPEMYVLWTEWACQGWLVWIEVHTLLLVTGRWGSICIIKSALWPRCSLGCTCSRRNGRGSGNSSSSRYRFNRRRPSGRAQKVRCGTGMGRHACHRRFFYLRLSFFLNVWFLKDGWIPLP